MPESAKERIMTYITKVGKACAAHEIELWGISANAISTRLNELEREGKLKSNFRIENGKKKPFKEWGLPETQIDLI